MTDVIVKNYHKYELECLVCLGGGGTQKSALRLHQAGLNVITLPKTIDNDVAMTDATFGFATALDIATEAIDRLHTTAESHQRVMIVEVMGRDAGWIALHSGLAGGADVILIPEIPFTIETVCEAINKRQAMGRSFCLVVVAEGAQLPEKDALGKPFPKAMPGQVANSIGYAIREFLKREVRVTVLGHVQRGGSPSPFDRTLATRFGVAAVDLIANNQYDRMVCLRSSKIESVPLTEAIGANKLVDTSSDYVRAARAVGITFGDHP
jgi:6-phosphofructokinase 1